MKSSERNQWMDALLDGELSEEDFQKLEQELLSDPEARQVWYDRLKLHTALELEMEDAAGTLPAVAESRTGQRQVIILALAAALACALMVTSLITTRSTESLARDEEPVATGFAVVAEQSGAVWQEDSKLSRGDLVPEGRLSLKSGLVQLELFSGVTVMLEGAAEFELHSSMEMSVHEGRMRALVPDVAQGFRVLTDSGEVVDLGTEFSLDVKDSHSELHVLDGEVEWHPESEEMVLLQDGEGYRWTPEGETMDLKTEGMRALGSFESDLLDERGQRRRQWLEHSGSLKNDPRLLVYYPMTEDSDRARTLTDVSSHGRNGTIVRAESVADRWNHPDSARDFSPTGSRVRLNVPGMHRSLTFYCWVRIDSLDRWYNSLFLTDGHDLHEPHWQIMDDGRLFFSVKAHDTAPDKHIAYSPPIWTPAQSGQWMQIATVYDGDAATTTHYVNGEAISVSQIPEQFQIEKVSIGPASICNWSEPMRDDPHFAVRNLNGAMDEFAIFAAALSAEEIQTMYEIGKP